MNSNDDILSLNRSRCNFTDSDSTQGNPPTPQPSAYGTVGLKNYFGMVFELLYRVRQNIFNLSEVRRYREQKQVRPDGAVWVGVERRLVGS